MFRYVALILVAGCGAASNRSSQTEGTTFEGDIRPLMARSCLSCHREEGLGPFPLETYEQVKAQSAAVRAAVQSRRMPPYLAGRGCADYQNDISLTDAEISKFGKWVEDGLLKGEPTDAGASEISSDAELIRVDRRLGLSTPYTVQKSPDDYRCFVLDWPETTEQFVTGFRVVPGNAKVVHHVIAYLAPPDRVPALLQQDQADPGDGYTCFGGPGAGMRQWLGAWAPGGGGAPYPAGTGLSVPPGSKVVLQIHYNFVGGAPESDQTQIELTLESKVEKTAALLLWADPTWVSGVGMQIPAYDPDAQHSFAFDPSLFLGNLTRGAVPNNAPFLIHSAALHQHLLGKSSKIEVLRGDGINRECLLDIPRWDFHWQRSYGFKQAKQFRPGDRLSLTCHWNNSMEAQPLINGSRQLPKDVKWGEGTADEMCLGVMYVTQ